MSELTSPIRVPKPGTSAVERARLALVPVRVVNAPRAPFAVLVFLILGAGVVGLLMFNTQMQQDSFYATKLQHRADALTAQREALEMQLDALRDPQHLAGVARSRGMVAGGPPTVVNLATGAIVGIPTPAKSADVVPIFSLPARLPAPLRPKPLEIIVPATDPAQTKTPVDGPASTDNPPAGGTNDPGSAAQGAPR